MMMWFSWLAVSVAISGVFLGVGLSLSKISASSREWLSPLECGFSVKSDSRQPVSLRFFIYAVIFVVFDVELVLVAPLVYSFPVSTGMMWFIVFLIHFLSLGLLLEWNNTAFEWVK